MLINYDKVEKSNKIRDNLLFHMILNMKFDALGKVIDAPNFNRKKIDLRLTVNGVEADFSSFLNTLVRMCENQDQEVKIKAVELLEERIGELGGLMQDLHDKLKEELNVCN